MDNHEQDQTNNDEQHQGKTAKDNIPLWLQGLSESTGEEKNNKKWETDEGNVPPEVEWVKEAAQESELQKQESITPEPEEPISHLPSENQITDWDQKMADDMPTSSSQSTDDDKNKATETGEILASIDKTSGKPQEDGDFIEISDFEVPDEHNYVEPMNEEFIPEDEELPDWLHEMIAEEPNEVLEETIPSVVIVKDKQEQEEEPTEPIDITQETQIEDEKEEEIFAKEPKAVIEELDFSLEEEKILIPPEPYEDEEEIILEEPYSEINDEFLEQAEPPFDPEFDSLPPEESLEPTAAEIDSASIPDEVFISEEHEIPKTLRFAKFLLDQGDYKQALDIIHTYIDKPEYAVKIEEWLINAVDNGAGFNSDVWESLGDIAFRNGNPDEAFHAYTKAINILLKTSREHHEND